MRYLFKCNDCKQPIQYKKKRFFSHIKCETCGCEYELTKNAWLFYMFIPFVAVGISVFISVNFIQVIDIFVKAVFIFSSSYILYYIICRTAIRLHVLQYTKR